MSADPNLRIRFYTALETFYGLREEVVSTLQEAAHILTDDEGTLGDHPDVRHAVAEKLRLIAAELCDHATITTTGACRYCDHPDVEALERHEAGGEAH